MELTQYRTKQEAFNRINELQKKHGINYTIDICARVKKSKLAYASCNNTKRVFQFPEFYAIHFTDTDFEKVILHEIAHALTTGHKHDAIFKRTCRLIGGYEKAAVRIDYLKDHTPEYLTVNRMSKKFVYTCPNGHLTHRARRINAKLSCGRCSNVFNDKFLLTLKEIIK